MAKDKTAGQIPDAYDAQGRPLFYHPPVAADPQPVQKIKKVIHKTTKTEKADAALIEMKHKRSVEGYPNIEFKPGEYVEMNVKRHPVALGMIWAGEAVLATLLIAFWASVMIGGGGDYLAAGSGSARGFVSVIAVGGLSLLAVFAYISAYVFNNNKLIVTNKRVMQLTVTGLFYRSKQIINLQMIKDISFRQSDILQYTFNFGTIHLSTIGNNDSTYTFKYVKNPGAQVRAVSKILEGARQKTLNNISGGSV